MLYYKERHPVLPERFITFLRCIRMIVSAPDSIYDALIVYTISYFQGISLKFHAKCQIWDTLSTQEMG